MLLYIKKLLDVYNNLFLCLTERQSLWILYYFWNFRKYLNMGCNWHKLLLKNSNWISEFITRRDTGSGEQTELA